MLCGPTVGGWVAGPISRKWSGSATMLNHLTELRRLLAITFNDETTLNCTLGLTRKLKVPLAVPWPRQRDTVIVIAIFCVYSLLLRFSDTEWFTIRQTRTTELTHTGTHCWLELLRDRKKMDSATSNISLYRLSVHHYTPT